MTGKGDYEVVIDPETVKLKSTTLFEGIGYCVSGNVNPSILKLLDDGGAKFRSFAGVGTTHFIAGEGADEMKMGEAKDIFEIPIIRPKWVLLSAAVGKLLPLHGFGRQQNLVFSSVIASVTSTRSERVDLKSIWCSISFYGGEVIHHITRDCTHLITKTCKGPRFERAKKLGIKIVTPDWVNKCIEAGKLIDESRFHPELLIVPQVIKSVPVRQDDANSRKVEVDTKLQTTSTSSSLTSNASSSSNVMTPSSQHQQILSHMPPTSQNILQTKLMSHNQTLRPIIVSNSSPRAPHLISTHIQQNQIQLQNLPQNQVHVQLQQQGTQLQIINQTNSQGQNVQLHQLQSSENKQQLVQTSSMQIQGQGSHQQFHSPQQIIQTSQHQQIVQTQSSHVQLQNLPPHSQQQVQNPQQLLQKQNVTLLLQNRSSQPVGQSPLPHQHNMQNQGSLQHLSLSHSQILHNQIPQQVLSNQGSQQILQNQIPPQQIQSQGSQQQMPNQGVQQMMQNQAPQQIMQNQVPQQMMQNSGPQQMMQNPGPQQMMQSQGPPQMMQTQGSQQITQNQGPPQMLHGQGPQQMMQSQSPHQMNQSQSPQQILQNQSPQQIMQNQSPQQVLQNQSPQQMMQNQSPQQRLQNQSPQQMMQNQSPQQMMQKQSPQQMMQNQNSQQILQNQNPPQLMQNQNSQQLMQNQNSQQILQNQNPPQLMQNQNSQQMMQNQNLQQLIQNQNSQLMQNQNQNSQLMQNQNQNSQLMQNQNQNSQLMQNQNQNSQHMQNQNQNSQLMQNQNQNSQLMQNQNQNSQLMQNQNQNSQLMQNQNQNSQQMMQNSNAQQVLQNQSSPQMIHNQASQQMIQGQGPQQMMQNQGPQPMMQNQGSQHMLQSQLSQQPQNQGNQQIISNQPNSQLQNQLSQQNQQQFQQQQMQGIQYQNQNQLQMQFQAQSPVKTQSPQQFGQVQQQHNNITTVPQHQVRLALQSPQMHNQQIHFQVVQQSPNRPQLMMGQMQTRNQFQPSQQIPVNTQNVSNPQTMFRQQQPQGQIQLFHPVQQQRMQSPAPNQQPQDGQQLQQTTQLQGQLQQTHLNSGQIQTAQIQQGQQHYNVVINQQFPPNTTSIPVHQQQVNQQIQPGQQQHIVRKVQFHTRPISQFTPEQQMEIIRQIQRDPNIQRQFATMDTQQRALLVQKLAQRNREEHLKREMMARQVQLTPQNSVSPQQGTQIIINQNQPQTSHPGGQTVLGVQNQGIGVQLGQMQNHAVVQGQHDKQLGQGSPQNHPNSGQVSALSVSQPVQQPTQVSMAPQQQILIQGHQDPQKPNQPLSLPNQIIVQNNQVLIAQNQQKVVVNPQSSPGNQQQKFLAPAPVQIRPPHGIITNPQQSLQGTGVVRTQQIFTPQVGQQQQRVNVRHVLVHPGNQIRPQQAVLQQQVSSQKMALMQAQQQNPGLQSPNNQWHGAPQRMGSPGGTNQYQARVQSPDLQSGGSSPHVWNVRPQAQPPQGPNVGQSSMPYVQVVNSKTKTALANLLSNRLQGNTGPESNANTASISTSLTATTSTTQTMCPPPPPPVTSQSLPQSAPATTQSNILIQRRALANITNGSKPIQVNSFGVSRVAVSQASPTLPTTPARPQFYGHDPQVKLSPEGFLIGCVFWAAEEMDHPDWQRAVMKFGGSCVEEYVPASVTHVLAKTQKFREFQQVIREGKRVVTLHWLSDILLRKTMLPPYYAIHLPVPFTEEERPMKDHNICISGYYDENRARVRAMCTILGAKWTSYFTKFNTCLVSNKAEGMKYTKAREWKKPVVSIQFLNEVMLGHFSSLQVIHGPKYQQFNLEQPFRFDIALAPHLMAAWKVPIRVSSEMVEKFKIKRPLEESNQESPRKKIKLEPEEFDEEPLSPPPDIIKREVKLKVEEGDVKVESDDRFPPVVAMSGFQRQTKDKIKQKVELLGGRVTNDLKEATHLILKTEALTSKLFIALSRVQFVVGCSWIYDSVIENKFIDEKRYICDHIQFLVTFGIKLSEVLENPGRQSLFKGIIFYLTKGIAQQRRLVLKDVIECAGGTVELDIRSLKTMRDTCSKFPKRNVIITCRSDFEEMEEFYQKARRPHMINIFMEDFLWKCIGTQKVVFRQ